MDLKTVICILLKFLFFYYVDSFGNYNIKLKGIEHDEGIKNPFLDLKDLKLRKVNKTHYAIDGIYNVLREDINQDNLLLTLTAAQKMGNGYQESALVQMKRKNYCEMWETEKYVMPSIKAAINDSNYQCPPKVATYALTNYIPNTDNIPPNSPTGIWRISFVYYDVEEVIGGFKVYLELKQI